MSKPVILTGLRANNQLHIGNYFGAVVPIVDMAKNKSDKFQVNLFVPDLHSFTTPIEHKDLQDNINQTLKSFVAAGLPLDKSNVHLYRQSYIPAHSEIAWILSCFTGFGEMNRMTQYKDKATIPETKSRLLFLKFLREANPEIFKFINEANDEAFKRASDSLYKLYKDFDARLNSMAKDRSSIGLFAYPILMAADILLYDTSYVPVGDDQTQHLEFTRDIAERMNSRFKQELFVIPEPVKKQHAFFGKDQGLRIRDLVNPAKKMSKSNGSRSGVIFLNDTPEEAHKKIMSATTDSHRDVQHNYNSRPGISNLLDLLELFGGNRADFISSTSYGPLKAAVANRVSAFLNKYQEQFNSVDEEELFRKIADSETVLKRKANKKLARVQKAVGLR